MAESNTIIHPHVLQITGEADFASVNKQFKQMLEGLDKVTKASAYLSKGLKQIGEAGKSFKEVSSSIAHIAGLSIGLKKSYDTIVDYSKSLIKLSVEFSKYGYNINQVESSLGKLSKTLNITRTDTLNLFSIYEKGFPYVSLKGAEEIFKNISRVTGANTEEMKSLAGELSNLVSKYPQLQKYVENLDKINSKRFKEEISGLHIAGKLSLSQYKELYVYADNVGKKESERSKTLKEYAKVSEDMKRVWQEIAINIGEKILPYFKDLSDWLKKHEDSVVKISGFIAKWVVPLMVLSGVIKGAASLGKGVFNIASGGFAAFGRSGGGIPVRVTNLPGGFGGGSGGLGSGTPGNVFGRDFDMGAGRTPGRLGRFWGGVKGAGSRAVGMGKGLGMGWGSIGVGLGLTGAASGIDLLGEQESDLNKRKAYSSVGTMTRYAGYGSLLGPLGSAGGALVGGGVETYGAFSALSGAKKRLKQDSLSMRRNKREYASSLQASRALYGAQYGAQGESAEQAAGVTRGKHEALRGQIATKIGGGMSQEEAESAVLGGEPAIRAYKKQEEYYKKSVKNQEKVRDDARKENEMKMHADFEAQRVQVEVVTEKREAENKLMESLNTKVLVTGIRNQKEYNKQVDKAKFSIISERTELEKQLKIAEKIAKTAEKEGENSIGAIAARKTIADIQSALADNVKREFDANAALLKNAKDIVAVYAKEAASRSEVLRSRIQEMQITGQIDKRTARADFMQADVSLAWERVKLEEELRTAKERLADIGEKDDNARKQAQDDLNEAQNKLNIIAQKRLAIEMAEIGLYDRQIEQARLLSDSAKLEVQMMDNFVVGLGASVQTRLQSADAVRKQIDEEKKAIDIAKERLKTSENQTAVQNEIIQRENRVKGLMLDEMNILRALRDGWVSSINAMTIGTGRIGKLKISHDENARQALQYMGMFRSSLSGATARPGEGPIGFATSERLMAGAGGLALPSGGGRMGGMGYAPDVGPNMAMTNNVVYGLQSAAQALSQLHANMTRGGTALGYTGSGFAGSAFSGPLVGSGKSFTTGGGQTTVPSAGGTTGNPAVLNFSISINISDVKQAPEEVKKKIADALNTINWGKVQ